MEEIIYQIECLGLPGFAEYTGNIYHFTIYRMYDNFLQVTGACRIKIPTTALNKEQEIATYPEQEDFIFKMNIEHLDIWNGVVEIKEDKLTEFLKLLEPHMAKI